MKTYDEVINEAIDRLSVLTGEGFHGYRSEVWSTISMAMREQDRNTRHACAEAILSCNEDTSGECIWKDEAHAACMNVQAI